MSLNTNRPAQKMWQTPQFHLIDQDDVNVKGVNVAWREVSETPGHAFKVQKVAGGSFGYASKTFYDNALDS